MHSKLVHFEFQNDISTLGPGLRPSRSGWADSCFKTSRIWWLHSITTVSMACSTALHRVAP